MIALYQSTGFILWIRGEDMENITIGKLAQKTGVNIETVRYYERIGLIPRPPRNSSGYRVYQPDVIKRIQFIKQAKGLGFSLKEIDELLSLKIDSDTPCSEVRRKAEEKTNELEGKIKDLQRMREVLLTLIRACSGKGSVSGCPILESLEK